MEHLPIPTATNRKHLRRDTAYSGGWAAYKFVNIDVTIEDIAGIPFAGNSYQLDLAIRTVAKDSNEIYFGVGSGGALPTGASTSANQDTQIDQLSYRPPTYDIKFTGTFFSTPVLSGNVTLGTKSVGGETIFDDGGALAGGYGGLQELLDALNAAQVGYEFFILTDDDLRRFGTSTSVIGIRGGNIGMGGSVIPEQWTNVIGMTIDGFGAEGTLYEVTDETTTLDVIRAVLNESKNLQASEATLSALTQFLAINVSTIKNNTNEIANVDYFPFSSDSNTYSHNIVASNQEHFYLRYK